MEVNNGLSASINGEAFAGRRTSENVCLLAIAAGLVLPFGFYLKVADTGYYEAFIDNVSV